MNVLITGDSHIVALLGANTAIQTERDSNREPAPATNIVIRQLGSGMALSKRFFEDRGDFAQMVDPECIKRFERLPPEDASYDAIGLSAPVHSTRIWRAEWKDFAPWASGTAGSYVVSQSTLRKIVDDEIAPSLELLSILRRTIPVFVVESPWPFRHHPGVKQNGAGKVQYLHRTFRSRALAALKARDIPVVEFDPRWADEEGFTRPQFRSERTNDHHHANVEFGRLMTSRIEDLLKREIFR